MLQDIGTETVILTPTAANAVQRIMTDRKLEGYSLRVFVAGEGSLFCSIWHGFG